MPGFKPSEARLRQIARERGYEIAQASLRMMFAQGASEWYFIAVSLGKTRSVSLADLADELTRFDGVSQFNLSYTHN